jgi:hypothetical protein
VDGRLVGRGGLEVPLVRNALRVLLLLTATSAAAGCFDVATDSMPLLIDNFDDGVLPADRHFDQWRCGKYNPKTTTDCECGYDAESFRSPPYSIYLQATVQELGEDQGAGAQLYAQGYVAEDLSSFREMVFSARYAESSPPNTSPPSLYVELWCSAGADHVHQSVRNWQVSDWQTLVLELSEFSAPWSQQELSACLGSVDGIKFSVNAGLQKDGTRSFVLNVDDVYFR